MFLGASTFLGATAYLGDTVPAASGGSWYGLLSILQSGRDEARQPHREDDDCPIDGTPYKAGPRSELFCPFCGLRPGGTTT